jgi:alpha-beta hydrolase superfamily lysophospholipase
LGIKAATYRLLAEGLAAHGIATVRIDKRGLFASAAAAPDANAVTIRSYADDVHTWVSSIRYQTGARCIWLLGHSEGGLVALAASQAGSDICGLVLVSTAGRPISEVLKSQLYPIRLMPLFSIKRLRLLHPWRLATTLMS